MTITDAQLADRIATEKKIVRRIVKDLLEKGYSVSVNDGEQTTLKQSTKPKAIDAAMFTTDEERLFVYAGDQFKGTVYLVYGNDGYDVISDYSTSLEADLAGATAYAEGFDR